MIRRKALIPHSRLRRLVDTVQHETADQRVLGGRLAPDRFVGKEQLEPRYRQIRQEAEAYAAKPSLKRMVSLWDAVETFVLTHPNPTYSRELSQLLTRGFARTGLIDRVRRKWRTINPESVHISKGDLKQLEELCHRYEGNKGIPEFGGGAKVIRKRGKLFVVPSYSNVVRAPELTGLFLRPFLESKSDLAWHTHPTQGFEGPSRGDVNYSRKTKIPIITIDSQPNYKPINPKAWLTVNGKTYELKVTD